MSVPVTALRDLDAFIPDTEIVVRIPEGTEGQLVQQLRNDIVLVQFNVPSLGPLRVALHDLIVSDAFDLLLDEMKNMPHTATADKTQAHQEADKILIRALRVLADDSNREQVEQLIGLYQKAIRWIYSRKDKKQDKKREK